MCQTSHTVLVAEMQSHVAQSAPSHHHLGAAVCNLLDRLFTWKAAIEHTSTEQRIPFSPPYTTRAQALWVTKVRSSIASPSHLIPCARL